MEDTIAGIHEAIEKTAGDSVCISNRPFGALVFGGMGGPEAFPGWAAAFVVAFPENVVDGKHVYFVEEDPEVRAFAAARTGHRIASLLTAPGECPYTAQDITG